MPVEHQRKLKRFEVPGTARSLTFSCYHQMPLLSNDRIKDAFASHLTEVQNKHPFDLLAWVVMPNHVHMIVYAQQINVTRLLAAIKAPFARQVINRWKQLDAKILERLADDRKAIRFWQRGGGYDRNLYSEKEIRKTIQYLHENPVRRNLAQEPGQWKWSSAGWYDKSSYTGPRISWLL
jgi:putative transposase